MRNRVPAEVLVKFRSWEDTPDRMPIPDAVFVNANVWVESPSLIRVPAEVLVKFRSCVDTPEKTPRADEVCVKANV